MKFPALLLAVAGFAQGQTFVTSTWSGNGPNTLAVIRFETRTEAAQPLVTVLPFIADSSGRTYFGPSGGFAATHRYFRDETTLVYFGYDLLIEPEPQPDAFRLSFYELSISPLDFASGRSGITRPTDWKKLPLPVLPQPRVVHNGDRIEVPVWIDPNGGQKLIDVLVVQQAMQAPSIMGIRTGQFSAPSPLRAAPVVPTVSGTAREFRADDAEMRLVQPHVTVNGTPEAVTMRGGQGATGALIWFYLPKRGRYILSLAPRPELGFVKSGEVRGGAISFQMDQDEFRIESPTPIAPGSAPYLLYVLHDKEWEPTARNQSGQFQVGSVSPGELAALMR